MNKYQNAMEIIKENIFKVNSSEEEKAQTHSDHLISVNQSIMRKIKEKERRKKHREIQFNRVDWQKKSMPELARIINTIFISEQKSVLHKNLLIEKIKNSHYQTVRSIEQDLSRLKQLSNGWLKQTRGWIRRNNMMDINIVCDSII